VGRTSRPPPEPRSIRLPPCSPPPSRPSLQQADGRPGTEFSFELELDIGGGGCSVAATASQAPTDAARAAPSAPTFQPDLRVLIADDTKMNLKLLQAALSRVCKTWNITATEVASDALSLYESAQREGQPFGLIIMDEHFDARSAGTLGTDVIRQIRAVEAADERGGRVAIISASGNGNGAEGSLTAVSADNATFVASGADDVWGKPYPSFMDGSMQQRLQAVLSRSSSTHQP
jgi:CheY-like chemotaxis protein